MKQFCFIPFLLCCFYTAFSQESAGDLYLRAKEKSGQEKYAEALKLVSKAIEIDRKNDEYYYLRSVCNRELRHYSDVYSDLNKAISLNPENGKAYLDRALMHYNSGNIYSALNDYNIALKYLREDSLKKSCYCNRSAAKLALRNFQGAIEDCRLVLSSDSNNITALNNLARALDETGKPDDALRYMQKVLSLDSGISYSYTNIGFLYLNKGEYSLSVQNFDRALKINPRDAYALNNRGFAKYKLNDTKGGLKDINLSIKLDPKNSYARRNRALIYLGEGNKEKACGELEKARQLGFSETYGNEVESLIDKNCGKK